MSGTFLDLVYLLSATLFALALRRLSHPRTAVRGNVLGVSGMAVAVVATLVFHEILDWKLVAGGLAVGGVLGALLGVKTPFIAMPQFVALLNGLGGGASALVAAGALLEGNPVGRPLVGAGLLSGLVGAVTFSGSLVATAKLQDWSWGRTIRYPGRSIVVPMLFLAGLAAALYGVWRPEEEWAVLALLGIASVTGIVLVVPIGGADMPVVIAFLNACSGLAAAATGFVLENTGLIIAGSLVGSSGFVLAGIMCRAMNRSLHGVLFGDRLDASEAAGSGSVYERGTVKATSPEEVAMMLAAARQVIVVPGYGMAAAQAQHGVAELARKLEAMGIGVDFAIHPVAGRMPGHMNVLLAEANVPYESLKDLESANPEFETADVALVVGANDVVNPAARSDPDSPIAGMPILDADRARIVVVLKRSLGTGFAGIDNPLFVAPNAVVLFGDAKKSILAILQALAGA